MSRYIQTLTLLLLLLPCLAAAQSPSLPTATTGACDCLTIDDSIEGWMLPTVADWGYGYANLLRDLLTWQASPYVHIDSIGASVLGRPLWKLRITSSAPESSPRRTVFIHVRTHPNEVQVTYVANAMINYLRSEQTYAQAFRDQVVLHIIPMYNPDGVELEHGRENANGVDLEREWGGNTQQPEPIALQREFLRLMNSPSPIRVALNLHSALACKRYFVFHDPKGTSQAYATIEQQFINGVRKYFSTGIQPPNYNVTWDTGTPAVFPESWWWRTQHENVLALTYEDMNCDQAGLYDSTAYAILHGVGDFLGISNTLDVAEESLSSEALEIHGAFPNPVISSTAIRYSLPHAANVNVRIYDELGREVQELLNDRQRSGEHEIHWHTGSSSAGIYICRITAGDASLAIPLSIIRQ